jgi:hypothetical protein
MALYMQFRDSICGNSSVWTDAAQDSQLNYLIFGFRVQNATVGVYMYKVQGKKGKAIPVTGHGGP